MINKATFGMYIGEDKEKMVESLTAIFNKIVKREIDQIDVSKHVRDELVIDYSFFIKSSK